MCLGVAACSGPDARSPSDDIFCSAKVDCTEALVHHPVGGARGNNAYEVDPSRGPGNVYLGGVGAPAPFVQAMVFEGREQLRSNGVDADKRYWNVALGLDSAWLDGDCVLETRATASRGPLVSGDTPPNTVYPFIEVAVPINTGAAITCTQHPLDGGGANAGVRTRYAFAPRSFTYVGRLAGATFTTDPVDLPVNECLANPCGANATCTDTPASYSCACNTGFEGNGLVCTDIDACDDHPCDTNAECDDHDAGPDAPSGRTCTCDFGFEGDGETCEDTDACDDHPCDVNAECDDHDAGPNDPTGRTCTCDPGFDGDGESRADIDECDLETDLCDDEATCDDTEGSYTCTCDEGLLDVSGDGTHCDLVATLDAGGSSVCALTDGAYTHRPRQ